MNKKPPVRSRNRFNSILILLPLVCFALSTGVAGKGVAAEYDPQDAGHPLRVMAYLVFPLGTIADYCFMRPGFWIVQREPFASFFGYKYIQQLLRIV